MSFDFNKDCQIIGVCAPSSYIEKSDIERAQSVLTQRGYQIFIHPQSFEREGQLAGSVQSRIAALHDLYSTPEIGCIWAAGGGNGASWLIDHIDYDLIRKNPKPLIGFSDITALHNAVYAHTGHTGIHGSVFKQIGDPRFAPENLDSVLSILENNKYSSGNFLKNAKTIYPGKATGHIIGGNLSVFQFLPATLADELTQGAILCLEDCGEELSHLDRSLLFLKRSGVLNKISGAIFGNFSDAKDSGRPYEKTMEDIIAEHFKDLSIPVLISGSFGHGQTNTAFKIGQKIDIDSRL